MKIGSSRFSSGGQRLFNLMEASNLLIKLSQRLFADTDAQAKFVDALINPRSFNPCILWCQLKPKLLPFAIEPPVDWQPEFVDRLAIGEKPGQHLLHQQGYFYCLDFSSVFAASPLLTIPQPVSLVVDMCAAPGGKSIFAWSAIHPRQLISNEVIGKRLGALISNLRRCQIAPAAVLSFDSKILADAIPQTADVVLVDAPCTGQSLLAKGDKAPGCFHPVNINKNANRQKRILANSAQLVAPQGYLAYMTCAYSPEENEEVSEWLLTKFPQFQSLEIPHLRKYQSHLTSRPCYRLFPQDRLGAGAFTILFQNTETGERNQLDSELLARPVFKAEATPLTL
jgi:16S rRNA C967 or C1407 C5-methylase (RsmB/RsmF family)